MADNYFDQILRQTGGQERSYRWFQQKIREFGVPSQKQLLEKESTSYRLNVGNMNFFVYVVTMENKVKNPIG